MERSLLLFRESIKTKVTFQVYERRLREFMRFCNVDSFDELTQVNNLQELLEDYIIEKKQTISPNSVPNYFWPIKTFCESNEIELKWKKIQRFFPSKVKTGGKRPYKTADIQKMLDATTTLRGKAIIHFIACTGVRIGSIVDLKIKNLIDMPLGCKAVCIYEGEVEEYFTFTTPECSEILDRYIQRRRTDGEHVSPESPLFRQTYGKRRSKKVRKITTKTIRNYLERMIRQAGLDSTRQSNGRRESPISHAFRKRMITILKNTSGINNSTSEKLAGHKIYYDSEDHFAVKHDNSYNLPDLEKMFSQYRLAIPELTISDMARVQMKETQMEKQYSALEEEKKKHFEEKKKWYKTILERAKTEGSIPNWLRPIMDEMIQDFES